MHLFYSARCGVVRVHLVPALWGEYARREYELYYGMNIHLGALWSDEDAPVHPGPGTASMRFEGIFLLSRARVAVESSLVQPLEAPKYMNWLVPSQRHCSVEGPLEGFIARSSQTYTAQAAASLW